MHYQWGRKDPFVFATSSKEWGYNSWETGKYPVKIYTIDGVLIYQDDNGRSNTDKQPEGGIIHSSTPATSMMETIKSPITFYGDRSYSVINQTGHTRSLYDYYWASYSRGTDGNIDNQMLHNDYLDGYISQRFKSIYDPCPYGYKISTNGVYNDVKTEFSKSKFSYNSGVVVYELSQKSWICNLGVINASSCHAVGGYYDHISASIANEMNGYSTIIYNLSYISSYNWGKYVGHSVRCIEELCSSIRPDRRARSVS